MIIFDEMKEELKNKGSKIDELNQNAPLNFDEMSDVNYHVLTGMNRDQFYNLCSEIPPSPLTLSRRMLPNGNIKILLSRIFFFY